MLFDLRQQNQHGQAWANAPSRKMARAWGPLATALEDQAHLVTWMPAHYSAANTQQAIEDRSRKRLSDGTPLTRHLVLANGVVDEHAKVAAEWRKPPPTDTRLIRSEANRLYGVAMWIGRATEAANHWPAPSSGEHQAKVGFVRDSEATAVKRKPLITTRPVPSHPATERCTRLVKVSLPALAPRKVSSKQSKRCNADWSSQLHSRAVKQRRLADVAEADGQALRLQDWVHSRPALRPPPMPAEQRLLAVRERLAAKRRKCGCAVLGPACRCDCGPA